MRIITLKAENVKRLKAVEISPDGDVVVIAGRNAQGKTSVLDAIWMALAGAAGAKETSRPIRDGEKQASVVLDLGDLVVTRKWTDAGTSLAVAAADGAKYPSPQSVLDGLIGRLTFDPLAFAEASQKDQLATLLSVVELPFDPAKLAMERQGIFDQRTDVNREIKRLEGAIGEIPDYPDGTPDEEVSVADIAEELALAERLSAQYEAMNAQLQRDQARLREIEEEARVLRAAIASGKSELERYSMPDADALRERMASAESVNAHVRAQAETRRLVGQRGTMLTESERLTARLAEIDRGKADALAKAKMPLEGLSFDDEGVLFNGVPFSQVSDSEKLRASMAIAMALNPKIRVLRITDGSLLDSENMRLISEMAGEHDFQVWIERVDESGEVGVTIEDGAVA
ncbi:MAG: family ATPase [Gaiellaceae bacterium]|jgi:hypothetical protein|nr:family ATPase [Gaiellaceae bacterium]